MTEWHPLPSLVSSTREDLSRSESLFEILNQQAERRGTACKNKDAAACMPRLDHLTMQDFGKVYEPSDDTFLLLDGIQLALMTKHDDEEGGQVVIDGDRVRTTLEIGCGTAVPTVFLARQLLCQGTRGNDMMSSSSSSCLHIVTDINPHALRVARATAMANDIATPLEAIRCDLAVPLLPRLTNGVDVLLFNPPYVPTPDAEVGGGADNCGIEASWAGGRDGRVVMDRAIPQIGRLLSQPNGVAFVVTVDDNHPDDLRTQFLKYGLHMTPWIRRRARNEYLTVQKITWIPKKKEGTVSSKR